MEPIPSCLSELESQARQNLAAYLQRELDREYQPKHRSKAAKLISQIPDNLKVSGEQIVAHLDEAGKSHKVEMTFPLFDLDADFTLIKCSCMREALSFEPQRCHHMYKVQDYIATQLARLISLAGPVEVSGPMLALQSLLDTAPSSDAETWLLESRWLLLLELASGGWSAERMTRNRYQPDEDWKRQGRWPSSELLTILGDLKDALAQDFYAAMQRGAAIPECELFEILTLAMKSKAIAIEQRESRVPLSIKVAAWQLAIVEEAEGYRLKIEVIPAKISPWKLVRGRGLIAFDVDASEILLVAVESQEERLLQGIMQQTRLIAHADRDQMLTFIEKLDPNIAVLWAGTHRDPEPALAMQPLLRLTPFQGGGMKIELWLQLSPGTLVRSAVGPELWRERSRPGASRTFLRSFADERAMVRRLEKFLDLDCLPQPEAGIFIAYNDELALTFMGLIEKLKSEWPLLLEWPLALANKPKPYAVATILQEQNLRVNIGEKRDWFAVDGWLEIEDGQKIALQELLAACRQKKRYLLLSDGKWAIISDHFRERLEPLVQRTEEDDGDCLLDLSVLENEADLQALAQFDFAAASQNFWRLVQKVRFSRQTEGQVPSGLKAELRSYQIEGFQWLYRLAAAGLGACLADDMGLGKTVQALAVLLKFSHRGPSLVIAPSSLAYNWQAESLRFCPDLKPVLLRELSDRGRDRKFKAGELIIASYGLVLRYGEQLAATQWNILILDEAQQIKNAQTKTAKAVQCLTAEWRLALSGTPIENHLGELWSLFRTLSPGLFGEWERFRRSFAFPIERDQSASAIGRLKRKIDPFILRRMKRDYLSELPPKTEIDLWIDLSDAELEFYNALRGEAIDQLSGLAADAEAIQQQKIQVLAALTRLRQAACHRVLLDKTWEGKATKIELLREQLLSLKAAGHSALVFSQFTKFLHLIAEDLRLAGLKLLYLDGTTPIQRRLELVQEFQAGGIDAFLISLKAGGTGLNLTQASYVFHMDPWWNPAVEDQASDRAWRMGQAQAVNVYKMRARGTIEEMIHTLHAEKKNLVESLLEGRLPEARFSWTDLIDMFSQKTKKPDHFQEVPKEQ